MPNENAIERKEAFEEEYDWDEVERALEESLETQLCDAETIKEEISKIGSPETLGSVLLDTVWEQFATQMGIEAGKEFIKNNNGLTLDLRNDAHIQTTENFDNGKIASHNTKIDYQKRYDTWQESFQHNDDGSVKTINGFGCQL